MEFNKMILVLSLLVAITILINIILLIKYQTSVEIISIPAQILKG